MCIISLKLSKVTQVFIAFSPENTEVVYFFPEMYASTYLAVFKEIKFDSLFFIYIFSFSLSRIENVITSSRKNKYIYLHRFQDCFAEFY